MTDPISNSCPQCGKKFRVTSSQCKRGRGVYCSASCKSIYRNKVRHEKLRENRYDFWSRVDKTAGADECWPWTGHRMANSYGRVRANGKATGAHRVALETTAGPPPSEGLFACHSCDNPCCCNPKHLRWATHQDNVDDKVARGRARSSPRKIDYSLAVALRREGKTYRQIAEVFGVNQSSVAKALLTALQSQEPTP